MTDKSYERLVADLRDLYESKKIWREGAAGRLESTALMVATHEVAMLEAFAARHGIDLA